MALKTSKATGKWSAIGTWTPESKPATTDEIKTREADTVEVNKIEAVRALIVEGTLSGAFAVELGDAIAPTEAAFSGIALKVTASATWSQSGTITFKQSSGSRLAIATGGKSLSASTVKFASGKYEVSESLTLGSSATFKAEAKSDIKVASGTTLKASVVQFEGEPAFDCTGATIICKEFTVAGTGSVTAASSTIEITGSGVGQFNGGGISRSFNIVKLVMREGKVDGEATVTTLEVLNKAASGEGWKFKPFAERVITFTNLEFNGKAGELSRVESETAGEKWKLKGPGGNYTPANSFVAVKDLAYENGDLYLPHGEDLGGNNEHVHFEAVPSGVTLALNAATAETSATLSQAATKKLTAEAAATTSASLEAKATMSLPLANAPAATNTSLAATSTSVLPLQPATAVTSSSAAFVATKLLSGTGTASTSASLGLFTTLQLPLSPATATTAATLTIMTIEALVPCRLIVNNRKQVRLELGNRKQVRLELGNRKQAKIGVRMR